MKLHDSIRELFQPLAMRADVRAPLPNHQPLDWCSAVWAGAAFAPVNAEMVLKIPTAVHPVDTSAIALYAFT